MTKQTGRARGNPGRRRRRNNRRIQDVYRVRRVETLWKISIKGGSRWVNGTYLNGTNKTGRQKGVFFYRKFTMDGVEMFGLIFKKKLEGRPHWVLATGFAESFFSRHRNEIIHMMNECGRYEREPSVDGWKYESDRDQVLQITYYHAMCLCLRGQPPDRIYDLE